MNIPLVQVSGAIAGGLIGGFAGFISNNIQRWLQTKVTRRNVASALIGEIGALQQRLAMRYLPVLRRTLDILRGERRFPSHQFVAEREYAPVFRSLGHFIGYLPTPLPQELVTWYTDLSIYLERAHELHDLLLRRDPELLTYAIEIAEYQYKGFSELVEASTPLVDQLSQC
jgi:hypothetical protein